MGGGKDKHVPGMLDHSSSRDGKEPLDCKDRFGLGPLTCFHLLEEGQILPHQRGEEQAADTDVHPGHGEHEETPTAAGKQRAEMGTGGREREIVGPSTGLHPPVNGSLRIHGPAFQRVQP